VQDLFFPSPLILFYSTSPILPSPGNLEANALEQERLAAAAAPTSFLAPFRTSLPTKRLRKPDPIQFDLPRRTEQEAEEEVEEEAEELPSPPSPS
jgi:hypothetical protein